MLAGQQTKFLEVPYRDRTSAVVISFTASAYLVDMKGDELLDGTIMLPSKDADHFILLDKAFSIPDYDTAETLVRALVGAGIVRQDDIVASVLEGQPKAMSSRTMQRHFHEATGLSHKGLEKIRRAQDAAGGNGIGKSSGRSGIHRSSSFNEGSQENYGLRHIGNGSYS